MERQPGWEIYKEYVDSGFSGAKASRPALDALMKDASKKKFNAVVVYKLDRFGRSVLNRVLSVRLRKESPGLFLREIGDAENGAQREPSSETVALRHPVMPVTDGFSG